MVSMRVSCYLKFEHQIDIPKSTKILLVNGHTEVLQLINHHQLNFLKYKFELYLSIQIQSTACILGVDCRCPNFNVQIIQLG